MCSYGTGHRLRWIEAVVFHLAVSPIRRFDEASPLALSFRNPSRDGIHDFSQGSILFDHQGVVRHFQCG
jgi:hypothetical protein